MTLEEFKNLVKQIVKESCKLKDSFTDEKDAPVNYACIFCQSDEEYKIFFSLAEELGKVIKDTATGPLFHIKDLETVAGNLKLLKIRKPDETRKERGDADFTVSDYIAFKNKYLHQPKFSLIEREDHEMIELVDSSFNVRTYFSYPPLDQLLGV